MVYNLRKNEMEKGRNQSANSILVEHYDEVMEQLTNPVVIARLLLVEGLFDEQDLDELERKHPLSTQKDIFRSALENVIDNYEYLAVFAAVLLKHKSTVSIGKMILRECGKL